MVEREEAVLLPVRGRVDVWLELSEPVLVQRPLREPLLTRHLAVAGDDAQSLVRCLLATVPAPARRREPSLGLIAALIWAARCAKPPSRPDECRLSSSWRQTAR